MDINLELDTRNNERPKENLGNQEIKTCVTESNSLRTHQDSSSKNPHHKKNKKGKNFKGFKDKPHASLLNKDRKLIGSEKGRRITKDLCDNCGGKNPIGKCFKSPESRPGSSTALTSKQGKAGVGIMMFSMVLTYFLQENNRVL
ncbi:hypothetical protein O181_029847 [Austropuccinia psidii MF-1]|uniref:Uncharacterized protein n=1 Tax=Austropuccinia psidii MF-1 TaxID=1389203 RepID=A0A9Q3CUL1_9BASI|nr:hypothetical protein [Austropuccinia psidii MF-1]